MFTPNDPSLDFVLVITINCCFSHLKLKSSYYYGFTSCAPAWSNIFHRFENSNNSTIPNKIWGKVCFLRKPPPLGHQLQGRSRASRTTAVWTNPSLLAECRMMTGLTLERMTVWQVSGQAYRAPPILPLVWSLVERVFLKQGKHRSQSLLKTTARATCKWGQQQRSLIQYMADQEDFKI